MSTYFWAQKKDANGENYVLIDQKKASFGKLPRKFLERNNQDIILYHKVTIEHEVTIEIRARIYNSEKSRYNLYILGSLNKAKDSSGVPIPYSFCYSSSNKIDVETLKSILENLDECIKKIDDEFRGTSIDDLKNTLKFEKIVEKINNNDNLVKRMLTGLSPERRKLCELIKEKGEKLMDEIKCRREDFSHKVE